MQDKIIIQGAKENNLKNIFLEIPKNQFVVFTGLSGSGKSTLAFDTLYAEGQRRYLESLSSYARQFLDKVGKPNVDKIDGLTPAIAIEQKTTSKNPRSTVGTITEIYDYLRLLFARIGEQFCPTCLEPISSMSATDIISQICNLEENSKIIILAPIIKDKKGTFNDKLESLRLKGYVRAFIDGVMVRLDEEINLHKTKKHTIKVVVDRVVVNNENHSRIASAVEKALKESYGELEVEILQENAPSIKKHYSEHKACFKCKISFEELEPLSFSFNSPKGACESCLGLGTKFSLDVGKILEPNTPLNNGAIKVIFGYNRNYYAQMFEGFCESNGIDMTLSFNELNKEQQDALLYGNGTEISFNFKNSPLKRPWKGIIQIAYDMFKEQKDLSDYMSEKTCSTCKGHRLKASSLSVQVAGLKMADFLTKPIEEVYHFFKEPNHFNYLKKQEKQIAEPILKEILERVFFLYDVGLGYLTLGRDARTISGGESQRIRIASQIGSGLTGVLYVLDEPSIGLHEKDTLKLINTLRNLQKKGNTLIVVEHDKETIKHADFIVDIGPKAGRHGGEVIFSGSVKELLQNKHSTALYLNGTKKIERPKFELPKEKHFLEIKNVNINNIKNLSTIIPLKQLVCITGVSGSGKSSLMLQTLLPTAQTLLNHAKKAKSLNGVEILGLEHLDKVIYLDQAPIGKTPRSNPATYTGIMDEIRILFAEQKEAKVLGYSASRFSFNVKGGRCEKCQGDGDIKIEMHFLPDVLVQCDSCKGTKYNPQTLEIKIKGKSIADVLSMSVEEAYEFFAKFPKIAVKLKTLIDVGLGYITLGQNATTLSGGEAQRIKLAKELSRKDTGKTLYVLDEPTTGLHFEDVNNLLQVLHSLVALGNSMLVIEHNLDIIKNADYIIDMGPDGGDKGGQVIASGTPLEVAQNYKLTKSYTAKFLAKEFDLE
ncbi:excinuclease ABC subunit A [Helicobacter cetorum MIT 99-5656]|uniref:UvrABC system protein A n=1 Tax=Helicobacter cetorum (strain ATCC BAA-540 / CCUG 52418 / MIT 99-5656) TaxID=1163745 RepID=I0EQM2_HELCM|nr:excinuclease ABC subunit UvrA [Helicobacter cetorum]AFI05241.1 excinuclease ABC subunit A [Helicobacter cetorum MIT 99-5656]